MKITFSQILALLILIAFSLANSKCHQSDTIQLHYLPDPFRVVGKASGVLQSEQVQIGLTVETLEMEAASSLNKNSQIINSAITAFKTIGLTESEFSTNGLSVYPSYIQEYDKTSGTYHQVFEGYKVRNSITVNTKKIDLAGKVIDNAVQSGVTNIDFISYSPLQHNIVKLKEKLLAEAVRNATKQAEIVLSELNYQIVSVKNIQILDQQGYRPPYQPTARPMAAPQPEAAPETKVFGSIDRQEVQVEIYFIIKPSSSDSD